MLSELAEMTELIRYQSLQYLIIMLCSIRLKASIDIENLERISPSPQLDNIRVTVIVWRLRENIIRTALCSIV